MNTFEERALAIDVDASRRVSALLVAPDDARAVYVFAHGAGAGMKHAFMRDVAFALAARGVATLRYQFPYMERGSKRVDPPALCHATVRAAVAEATRLAPGLPLYAAGKSFGGRMTSQAQAASPLSVVRGLIFFGFPLHPPGKPSDERGQHLFDVKIPMLFLQGTRDDLADLELMAGVCERLRPKATLHVVEGADHSFAVLKRSGRTGEEVLQELVTTIADWTRALPA